MVWPGDGEGDSDADIALGGGAGARPEGSGNAQQHQHDAMRFEDVPGVPDALYYGCLTPETICVGHEQDRVVRRAIEVGQHLNR